MLPSMNFTASNLLADWTYPYSNTYTPLLDKELGGIALNDASQGHQVQVWECGYENNDIWVRPENSPTKTVILSNLPDVTEVSLTFDQLMRPTIAYVQYKVLRLYWYDTLVQQSVISSFPDAVSAKVRLDDKRPLQIPTSDILFFYIEGDQLLLRLQSDRYTVPYTIATTTAKFLVEAGMDVNWRIQVLGGKPFGGFNVYGNEEVAKVMLRWSDDGGHTWSNEHWASMGAKGEYGTRVIWRRLGMTGKLRDRVYEVSGTDPVKIAIMGAELKLSPTNG